MINDGGLAFPAQMMSGNDMKKTIDSHPGMTLRDYFAAKAMQGVLAASQAGDQWAAFASPDKCAAWSYEFADAMLKAREAN